MNLQKSITLVFLSLALFTVLSVALCRPGLASEVYLDDRLKPGELSAIRRDLPRAQWAHAREALADLNIPAFAARLRDLAFGRTCHVYRHWDGYITVDCGWSGVLTQLRGMTLFSNRMLGDIDATLPN